MSAFAKELPKLAILKRVDARKLELKEMSLTRVH